MGDDKTGAAMKESHKVNCRTVQKAT